VGWGPAIASVGRFDLIFIDAPYRLADRVGQELNTHLPRLLVPGGRAIVESGARRPLRIESLEPLRQRRYGAADVSFYGVSDDG
jgi:16S rRNA (guanine966-N2)-methyltransferase